MKSKEYLPQSEAELAKWCVNFAAQFAILGPGLGFTAEEIAAVTTISNEMVTSISEADAAKTVYEEKVAEKKKVISQNEPQIRETVKRVKVAPTYTEAIGKALWVIGEGSTFDPTTAMPYVTLVKSATGYDFKFNLMNYFDAVAVFRRKPGETGFTQVAIDMKPPYEVASPVESGTDYKFQYMKNDKLMGLPSDIIVIEL